MSQKPAAPDYTACPHWGKGGRYVVDPATGARVPVAEPTAEPDPAPAEAEVATPARKAAKKAS